MIWLVTDRRVTGEQHQGIYGIIYITQIKDTEENGTFLSIFFQHQVLCEMKDRQ